MSLVRVINDDTHFNSELGTAGSKLVVVDFSAAWCGPCQHIAPAFERLSSKYPNAIFLKVDVDHCKGTAKGQGVTAMPTFIFYRNRIKLGSCQGADESTLESNIKKFYGFEEASDGKTVGQMDLCSFISTNGCECLNESDNHCLADCLSPEKGYLESDCDEQLIISITFKQYVKVHSLKIKAPKENGPKSLKLFINFFHTIDFQSATEAKDCVQELTLSESDLEEGKAIPLTYRKFQSVLNLQIFVLDNQSGAPTTRIDHLCIIGLPISTTNMGDFKRIVGKKGESH